MRRFLRRLGAAGLIAIGLANAGAPVKAIVAVAALIVVAVVAVLAAAPWIVEAMR